MNRRPLDVVLLTALFWSAGCATPRPRPQIHSYACYYGSDRLEELAQFDLLVLQPNAYNPEDIAFLKSHGATVLAYISVGEDDELHRDSGTGPGGWAPWYLDQFTGPGFTKPGADKTPDTNAEWGSYYVDPSHPRWRKHTKEKIRELKKSGYDGVFVDTAQIPRNVFTIDTEKTIEKGMETLVRKLRTWWPSGYLLVNNGFEHLEEWKDTFDGLMLENFTEVSNGKIDPEHSEDMEKISRHINHYRQTLGHPWDVFTLDYLPNQKPLIAEALRRSQASGFLPAVYNTDRDSLDLKKLPLASGSGKEKIKN